MTTLAATPVDPAQLSILDEITDVETPLGSLHAADFREACWQVQAVNGGWVNPNLVSAHLHERFGEIGPNWYSAQWAPACSPKGFLDKTDIEVPIDGKHSRGNGNKGVKLRRWRVGAPRFKPPT